MCTSIFFAAVYRSYPTGVVAKTNARDYKAFGKLLANAAEYAT